MVLVMGNMVENTAVRRLPEIVVDNFAGGGGASTGIEIAIGHSVDVAINHDPGNRHASGQSSGQ